MAGDLSGAVYAILQGDATLAAIATGGGYQIDKLGSGGPDKSPINPKDTPDAYTLVSGVPFLKPIYTVRTMLRAPVDNAGMGITVELRALERAGYQNTRAILDRALTLLTGVRGHGLYLTAGGKGYVLRHSTDLTTSFDDSILNGHGTKGASMEASTYYAIGGMP